MALASPHYLYIDPSEGSPSGNVVTSWSGAVSYISTTLSNNIGSGGSNCVLHIRVCGNASVGSGVNLTSISGQDADHQIVIYGWDRTNAILDRSVVLSSSAYTDVFTVNDNSYVTIQFLIIVAGLEAFFRIKAKMVLYNCHIKNWNTAPGTTLEKGLISRCLYTQTSPSGIAIKGNPYSAGRVYNTIIYNCSTGIDFQNPEPGESFQCWNNVVFGNSPNYINSNIRTYGGFNTIQSGNTNYPDTVSGGSTYTISSISTHFPNYTTLDFSLDPNSALRAGNVGFPNDVYDNKFSFDVVSPSNTLTAMADWQNETLPTTGQWDIGYDQYVVPITGTRWILSASNFLTSGTNLYEEGSPAITTTFQNISSGTNLDDLLIPRGVTATWNTYDNRRGMGFEVEGILNITNNSTSAGRVVNGYVTKKCVIKATGQVNITGGLIDLGLYGTSGITTGTKWKSVWTSATDTLGNLPEPSYLMIGQNTTSANVFFNKGSMTSAFKTDVVHGRFFKFNKTTGAITFSDYIPTSADHIYCANLFVHSKDGQSTNALSYGFDTFEGGILDCSYVYFTGSLNIENASKIHLTDCGSLQAPTIKNCTNINLHNLVVSFSDVNTQNNSNQLTFTTLSNELEIGKFYIVRAGTGFVVEDTFNIKFSACIINSTIQTSTNQVLYLSSSLGACPNTYIDELYLLGTGIRCDAKALNNLTINHLYHSDQCLSASSQGGQHPIVQVLAVGGQTLKINSLSLLQNGVGTKKEILDLQNFTDVTLTNVDYREIIKSVAKLNSCKQGLISGVIINSMTGQDITGSGIIDYKFYNGYCLQYSNGVDSYSHILNSKIIDKRNWMYQISDSYQSWVTALPNTNFLELNKRNQTSAWDGVYVFNYFRTSEDIFVYTSGAVSNNDTGVILDSVNSTVEYEMTGLKTGGDDYIFTSASPTFIGTGKYQNFNYDYKLDKGSGYSSYKSLNAINLSAENFSSATSFDMTIRVACPSGQTSANNSIQQVILYTSPRPNMITYSSTFVNIVLQNVVDGSRYRVYNETSGEEYARAEHSTGEISINNIPYSGSPQVLRVTVRKSSGGTNYKPFETFSIMNENGSTVYVSQIEDNIKT